jgi:hypothetical protein
MAEEAAPRLEKGWGRHELTASGLYPLWEDTGTLLEPGGFQLSTSAILAGLTRHLQIGLQPTWLLHRAPNLEAKLSLYSRPGLSLALRQQVVVLFRDAQERMLTTVYGSRLANPSAPVFIAPLSLHASWQPFSRLLLHGSATVLPVLSDQSDFKDQASAGLSLMVELPVLAGHSLLLHGGEVGIWDHDFAYVGASYRLNYSWFFLQLGYFQRIRDEGSQGSPLLNVGAIF